jgi:hypothetical protein
MDSILIIKPNILFQLYIYIVSQCNPGWFRTHFLVNTALQPLNYFFSDPVLHSSTGERSDVRTLLQKLILEDEQFDVEDILPNTVPDPASLELTSEYACPVGQVVVVPDCGRCTH